MGRKQALDRERQAVYEQQAAQAILQSADLEPATDEELTSRVVENSEPLAQQPAPPAPEAASMPEAAPGEMAPTVAAAPLEPQLPVAPFVAPGFESLVGQYLPAEPEFAAPSREAVKLAKLPTPREAGASLEPVEEEPSASEESAPLADEPAWPLPRTLLAQLAELTEVLPDAAWATRAAELIAQLCRTADQPAQAQEILNQLSALSAANATSPKSTAALESQFMRTRYSLIRWIDVWQRALALEMQQPEVATHKTSSEPIEMCLSEIEQLTRKHERGTAWREFLQLEALKNLSSDGTSEEQRRAQARKVLDRMASSRLSPSQKKFVNEGPLSNLQANLRSWAAEPVAAKRLLTNLERYEASGRTSDAQLVANDLRGLNWSPSSAAEDASDAMATHYRNANLRIAVAAQLVNRMVPQPEPVTSAVRDTVVNVPVVGCATTWTDLSVRLVPDDSRIRLGLEAEGLVDSNTTASSGPVTLRNEGRSTFLVRKLMVLGPRGLVVWPAVAEADNNFNYLVSMETDFDGVPLVGPLVRSIARNQHEESRGQARWETEQKVAMRARHQLDAEVGPRLDKAADDIQKKQLATLKRLGLEMEPVALSTTEERVVARVRLANQEQLGAHTPRPRAPSDSWLSLQLHQSAMNNAIDGLDLNGRKFTLPELFAWVAEKLDQPKLAELDDIPDDVSVTFADKDAVRLKCEDGGIEVTFAFARMSRGRKTWRNFTVRSVYRPEAQGLEPRFVRDDTIHLDGSLRGKVEPGIRAIFSRVLSKNRDLRLLDEKTTSDPRMQDLRISQFVSEDGWLGLAYSPQRGAKVAHRPQP